ncbi:MAG: hypothetical protein HKL96_08895 [Phycisphaerales bacterium]|nr:hypothetical protein [Phycisphaerales bacterium]
MSKGGAITWLSRDGNHPNMVNHADWGREIQMSDYSGPVPYIPPGAQVAPAWRGLGWNPVQAGDAFQHASRILHFAHGHTWLSVTCRPMQWPLKNYPAHCTFTTRLDLKGPAVQVDNIMINNRNDHKQYPARPQELPALYANGPYYFFYGYTGDKPFTNAPITCFDTRALLALARRDPTGTEPLSHAFHWMPRQLLPENWAAFANIKGHGFGIWAPRSYLWSSFFFGHPGIGGPKDSNTAYIAPNRNEILDYNIVFKYHYTLIIGSPVQVRNYVYAHAHPAAQPCWRFQNSRQDWTYHSTTDSGFPIRGCLHVHPETRGSFLLGPVWYWQATHCPVLYVQASFSHVGTTGYVYFRRFADAAFSPLELRPYAVNPDGHYRWYRINLAAAPRYRGAMVQLRLDLPQPTASDASINIKAISFRPPTRAK